jgi:NADH-quinone oxidoreductase subunit M
MERLPEFLPLVVLLVLAVPLGFAVLVAVSGRAAGRLAPPLALLHMGLTALLVVCAANVLTDRAQDTASRIGFQPLYVPGDGSADSPTRSGSTTWNLFTLAPESDDPLPTPAVQFFVGVDGLNLWLLALTSVMTYIAILVSRKSAADRPAAYFAWLFVLQAFITGAFLSFDIILFYLFFELTLVPTFFLIGGWGVGGGKRDAARKFFLYTLLGGLLTLTGIIGLVLTNPTPVSPTTGKMVGPTDVAFAFGRDGTFPQAGPVTFSIPHLMRTSETWVVAHREAAKVAADKAKAAPTPESEAAAERAAADHDRHMSLQAWLFFALIAGFVVKIPLVPFHTWLPAAYAEAPAAVTLLMSALLAKLGTLGLLRVVLPLCPDAAIVYGLPVFGFLGAVGIVYAALCAFAQRDIKMVAAYSSVSHLGLLVLGTFALNREGLSGSVLHMVNHGLTAGAMFALVAFLADRFKTTDATAFGGLTGKFPRYAFFMFVIALASVGLPGLNNFVSEMMLIAAVMTPGNTYLVGYGMAVTAAAGIFLSAWYLFTMLRKVFFGPLRLPPTPDTEPTDMTAKEWTAFGLPAVLCLVLGLYPQPVLDSVDGDVTILLHRLDAARERQFPQSYQLEQSMTNEK